MPKLETNKKRVEEGGTSSVLGEYSSGLLQGLILLSSCDGYANSSTTGRFIEFMLLSE